MHWSLPSLRLYGYGTHQYSFGHEASSCVQGSDSEKTQAVSLLLRLGKLFLARLASFAIRNISTIQYLFTVRYILHQVEEYVKLLEHIGYAPYDSSTQDKYRYRKHSSILPPSLGQAKIKPQGNSRGA